MASPISSRLSSSAYEKHLKRLRLRSALLENLERRELLAGDIVQPFFDQGTSDGYAAQVRSQLDDAFPFNPAQFLGPRWSNPVGGPSPNRGDPATITWSIVPDGTQVPNLGGALGPSNFIAFMDGIYGAGSNPGGPVADRPWFGLVERTYQGWAELSGITFVYEAADDQAPMQNPDAAGNNRGVAGVRGDMRVGGRALDGTGGVLAFAFAPAGGGDFGIAGDMVFDTNDALYTTNADPTAADENRFFTNISMHEIGHGIGLGHTIPVNQTKLMEPFVSTAYLGPQHDDILGAQELYGDTLENNDIGGQATQLGLLNNGTQLIENTSTDRIGDDDFYAFSVPSDGQISIDLEPIGESYEEGPQGGSTTFIDTLRNHDLEVELLDSTGTVLTRAGAATFGEIESITDFDLPAGGDYQIRVLALAGGANMPQLYRMSIQLRGLTTGDPSETPPRLLSVAPNVGEIFSFNRTNDLTLGPRELVFRFDGADFLDAASLDGIRITRAGFDDDFTDGDEVTLTPGFVGFGETDRIIIARFAETLPDDLYKVEVFGVDIPGEGISAVRNVLGLPLAPRVDGTDRDTLLFDLELGNQIVAVVPQPTSRDASGNISQARDQIEVYFSEGDRLHDSDIASDDPGPLPTVVDPSFYQLFSDKGTVSNTDDVQFLPTKVEYIRDRNMAVLTFASDIDALDAGENAFRLRVGTNEARPAAPAVVAQPVDPQSTFNVTGAADLGVLSTISSLELTESIQNATVFPLDFPGAPDTPGVREILDDPQPGESHILGDSPDSNVGLGVQFYNFNKQTAVAIDPATQQPLFSSITPAQEQRFREVLELFGSYLGIQFVETEDQGWVLATANIDGPGGAIGNAGFDPALGITRVLMDASENWNDEFGQNDDPAKFSYFVVAMHEAAHLLGLGHSSSMPPGSILGGAYSSALFGGEPELASGNPIEALFPAPSDLVPAQYLHRPDSRDIDMYRFEVAPGSAGEFTAEIIAERQANSSLLDSVLTLFHELPDGTREVVAVNDDYFSEDSYLSLNLQPGTYYLGVSASGNSDYNPEITDSGLGGTTEGTYRLRTTFRPLEAASIVDVEGSAVDGDADGTAGGVFNFWFNANSVANTIFVDKEAPVAGQDGSQANPFDTIEEAFAAAQPGDIVRIVANGGADGSVASQADNLAFEVGRGGLGNQVLQDGETMNIPQGVTVMVDAGVLFKMGRSIIGVGSSTSSTDRSQSNLQVLGTPEQQVFFTSYTDESLGVDTDPLSTTAGIGDWGGIVFRNALDRAEGRFDSELDGRFVNYVGYANMQFGGGQVNVDGSNQVIAPLHMDEARPTLINNTLTNNAFAAISADPNSFEESTFTTRRFQADSLFTPDYNRVGPEIHGNTVTQNTINGLFVRVAAAAGQNTVPQSVAGRWDDTDIVHVVSNTLTIEGTPGGPTLEQTPPELSVVNISDAGAVPGGQQTDGIAYTYRMTFLDSNGNEGVASAATLPFSLAPGSTAVELSNLPPATGDFVARRLYRSDSGGTFQLVAELDRSSTVHVDGAVQRGTQLNAAGALNRARPDASLAIDPGITVKLQGGRIVGGVSAQIVAEGREGLPVVFTSRQDDRYGAGGTFDTNNDLDASSPQLGDWGGLYFGHAGTGSLDHTLITYGGGITSVGGTFSGFNAIEVHQADVRIANSTIERNARGTGGQATFNREGFGRNEGGAIFVRGAQPIIVDNIIRENFDAAITIDPMSLSGNPVKDLGRQTGEADRRVTITENKGPLVRGNALADNTTNGMVIRGATLNTESVWDDADIVHVVMDEILIPDYYVFGGLRLQSTPNESLVVKFGPGAGLTANGRPLDIDDRIGGTIQVVGTPGFPVVMTSIADDSIGAGFGPDGTATVDTNGNGPSVPAPGSWRSVRIDEFAHDRNVSVTTELEPAQSTGAGVNGVPSTSQFLGQLAADEKSGDDNLRLGFRAVGTINNTDDIDVYSFSAKAGTQVWLDIDRTNISLDSVLELIDSDGNIIAQSDNSLAESNGTLGIFSDPAAIETSHVNAMQDNPLNPRNFGAADPDLGTSFADFYSTNPLDAGMRLVLPGAAGSTNTYFVRVRSSNIDSRDPGAVRADLQDPSKLSDGKTEGQYELNIRLRAMDEIPGSSVTFADIRYATNGIEVLGHPTHSLIAGEVVEQISNNDAIAQALDLGNLLSTDRAALSLAGELTTDDVDWFRFRIEQDSIQSSGVAQQISTIIDADYSDGFGGGNLSLWLFYDDQNGLGTGNNTGIRLVNFGTDSNIADDVAAPLNGTDSDDLSRGSAGVLDAFIGATSLPSGDYFLAVTSNEVMSAFLQQFHDADAGGNPLVRVEPISSTTRLLQDRSGATLDAVPYTLGDVVLFASESFGGDNSRLTSGSALIGNQTSSISQFGRVEDIAMRGDGILHGARSPQAGVVNDANSGGILTIDTAGNGTTAGTATSGIQTFELNFANNPPTVEQAVTPNTGGARQGVGMEFLGLTYPQEGNTQFLYAVGSRGDGSTSFQTFTGLTDARNYIYKLDPTSLQATSAPQANRANNARIGGAGTQIRERGYIDTSEELIANLTYQTIIMDDASPTDAPSLLAGDTVTLRTPGGDTIFEWNAGVLSATLIADTSPQADIFNFPPVPTDIFEDGHKFTLQSATDTREFEIDTGRVIVNNYSTNTGTPANYDGSTFSVVDLSGDAVTFEFDNTGGGVALGNVPIVYDAANATEFQLSQTIINTINNVFIPNAGNPAINDWEARAFLLPGTNRISLQNDIAVVTGSGLPTSTPNPLLISELSAENALAPGQTYDGATFTVTGANGTTFTFEYDTDNNVTAGNTRIAIQDTSTLNFIARATSSAINFPTGVNPPPVNWFVTADDPGFGTDIRVLNDLNIALTPDAGNVINPLNMSPEYGSIDGAADHLVPLEEFFTNLNDIQLLPTPSTQGAMDILVQTINNAAMGITATSIGTRLELNGGVAADFTLTDAITTNVAGGGGGVTQIPFVGNDTSVALNQRLLDAINAVLNAEGLTNAQILADGRIWLPGDAAFVEAGTNDRRDINSANAELSAPEYGFVTGIAFTGQTMWGVSENGDLYRVGGTTFNPNSTFNNGDFIETVYNTNTGQRVQFVSLTSGPRNAEALAEFAVDPANDGLDDTLFGLDNVGRLYAFDTQGRPAHVFNDGDWILQTDLAGATGLAFSNLDVNLWHVTGNNRNTDPGHGINISFDGSQRTQGQGGNSLYFGFENPNDGLRQPGDWSGVNNPIGNFPGYDTARENTYDFPGGVKGAIDSDPIDLSLYSPADKPYLYFNYYLETEDSNADNPFDNNRMLDSLRVLIAGDDGTWQLIGSNNSDYTTDLSGNFDEHDYPFFNDALANNRQVVEVFDAGVGGAPDSWRQARVDLSRWAGEKNVRVRFDFNTSGSAHLGNLDVGGIELTAIEANDIPLDEKEFVVVDPSSPPVFPALGENFAPYFLDTAPRAFEFDFGLVLQIPSGAALADGEFFEVDGTIFTFSSTTNAGNNVLINPTDTGEDIAARIAAKIAGLGLTPLIDVDQPNRISVGDAVNPAPASSATLPGNFFVDVPGARQNVPTVIDHLGNTVNVNHIPIPVSFGMTATEVRDSMRSVFAASFNVPGQEDNIEAVRVYGNTIRLWNKHVRDQGALGLSYQPAFLAVSEFDTDIQGDEFGEPTSSNNQVGTSNQRGQNNRFEGVYIDDIIVGFAERGEKVTYHNNSAPVNTSFVDNPLHEVLPNFAEIETGTYQIEIRRGPSFGLDGGAFPQFGQGLSFDTNDRHSQSVSLIAPTGAEIFDGQTFTLSDGIDTVTFEYDDLTITSGPRDGVAQGNVAVPFQPFDQAHEIAIRIRDAINSPEAQAVLGIVAALSDGTVTGNSSFGKETRSEIVHLHGKVSVDNTGSHAFDGTRQTTITNSIADPNVPGFVLYGVDNFRLTENGDQNRVREQGAVLVHSNIVRDSSGFGIVVDAGARSPSLSSLAGTLPHPGSVANLVVFNQAGLVPGPVVINNLVYANAVGGILFSGDTRNNAQAQASVPFGRIVNNTVVGSGGGTGISVTDNASPTLLNNIVADLQTGIFVDGSSNTTVIGNTTFQGNNQNVGGAATVGTAAQLLGSSEPLFVNAAGRNYYLADGSRAIDASIDSLDERQQLATVRQPLGIGDSPIIAPATDLTGQLRVDDPLISNPDGTGGNPFKDRGAYDRADFFGPIAIIQQPIDNDPDNVDTDRTSTFIQLDPTVNEPLDFFSILLFEEEGTGPDPATVTAQSVVLTENGRFLQPGIDYIFGYNPSSRLIRLTPLAGIWRNDSVYEITLNNQDGIRVLAQQGLGEGYTVNIDVGGQNLAFELDNDGTVATDAIPVTYEDSYTAYDLAAQLVAAINNAGMGLFSYLQGTGGTLMVHGATAVTNLTSTLVPAITDVAGNLLQANRISSLTQFTVLMPEVELDYGDAPAAGHRTVMTDGFGQRTIDASRHAVLPVDAPTLVLGSYVDTELDGQPNVSATGDDNAIAAVSSTIPGAVATVGGSGVFRAQPATVAINGQRLTITDPTFQVATFEFDTDPDPGLVAPGSIRVAVNVGDTADQVAAALRAAVNQAVLVGHIEGLNAFATGDVVDLGGTAMHTFDLSAGGLALTRIARSDFALPLPTDVSQYADGHQITLTGTAGRTVVFELEDTSPAIPNGVLPGNIAVPVDLVAVTDATEIMNAFADAINTEVAARRISLAPARVANNSLIISGNDEDGVVFNGLFNAESQAAPVTVTATGSGILDVWFDWNGDGDFADPGERLDLAKTDPVLGSSLPIQTGDTNLEIPTPVVAQTAAENFQAANPGERFFVASRFRLSTGGTPRLGEAGIGGEVEDYMVEIVVGAPPVANDDSYEVLEDSVLNVAALGILANDTDADHATTDLEVADEDPSTSVVDLVKNVERGTVVVNKDGSFTYTPEPDFFGTDTFVYNVTDPRLLSEMPATVTITVHPVNDVPTAIDDELSIYEDETILRGGATFTANDFRGVFGTTSQTNELFQNLSIIDATIDHPAGGTVSVANNELQFTPPAHYNNEVDGPVKITVTIQDDGTSFVWNPTTNAFEEVNDFLTDTSTLTINVMPLNDSPVFDMQSQVTQEEDAGPQTVNDFITNILPGPRADTDGTVDEASGGLNPENQTITFAATAQEPTLFAAQPAISDTGVLTFELNPDVTTNPPFPSQILVEVVATDTGSGRTIATNGFDAVAIAATAQGTYDGATFTIVDSEGNTVVFEFDDVNTPGVGSTGGVDHVAIVYDPATDTQATVSTKVAEAIANPPAASIVSGGAGDWSAHAFVDSTNGEIRVVNDASFVFNALINPLSIRQAFNSTTRTFTIVPEAINDAPEFDIPVNPVETVEDAGPIRVENFVVNARPGPVTALDELAAQSLTLTVQANDPSAFAVLPSITFDEAAGNATLTYETARDVNDATGHDLTIVVTLQDDGGVNRAGDVDTTVKTLTLSVTPVNDVPRFTIPTPEITVFEDHEDVTGRDPTTFVGFANAPAAGGVDAVDETTLPGTQQTLTFVTTSITNPSLFETAPAIDDNGNLTFVTADNQNGQSIVVIRLDDDGADAAPGDPFVVVNRYDGSSDDAGSLMTYDGATLTLSDANGNTVVFELDDVHLPGVGSNGGVPNAAIAFDSATETRTSLNQKIAAAINTPPSGSIQSGGGAGWAVTAAIDPVTGVLTVTGAVAKSAAVGQSVQTLRNTFPALGAGETFDGATITITDADGDVINFEFNDVTDVGTPTTGVAAGNAPIDYDPAFTLDQMNAAIANAISNPPAGIVAGLTGTWDVVASAAPGSAIVRMSGMTSATPNAATLPIVNPLVSEDLSPLDPFAAFIEDVNSTSPEVTYTINITPVNDPPEFTIPASVDSQEDQGLVSVPGFATNLRPGPQSATDEVGQQFTVNVEAVDPSLFSVQPAIAADGTLTFQTAPDVNSDIAVLNVRVWLTDDGTPGPLPDNNTSATETFTINTAPINDAPQFTLANTQVTVIEDVEEFLNIPISSVFPFATNIAPGPATALDEASQIVSFEVVSVSAPELFDAQPSVAGNGELTFKTAQHKNGTALVILRAVDDGTPTPPPNNNNSILHTFTITITPVNDAPEFTVPSGLTVAEDAGLISQSGFATDVRRGPVGTDDENSQLITFDVTATDPSAFAIQPAIAADGTLTFQTAEHVNSLNANLEVVARLRDNGPDSPAPNANLSPTQTFTISVTPVNDPPIADPFVANTTEDFSVTVQSSDVLVGDVAGPTPDELNQGLTITQIERTSANGGTIVPVFNGNEIVSFTYNPPANLVGTDTFLYVLTDDGTPSRSGSGTITINLAGINDAPQFVKGADQTVPEDAPARSIANWATGILAGPPSAVDEQGTQNVTFNVTSNNSGLFTTAGQPAVSSDGTLTYTVAKDANGTAVVTVIAVDDGLGTAPHVNESAPQTFTITVNPVNDAPAFTAGPDVTVAEDSGPFSSAWATNIAAAAGLLDNPQTATDETSQIVDFQVVADRPELFSLQPSVNNAGELTFTPAGDANGTAVVTVQAIDRGPAGGLDENTSVAQTLTITITPVNDAPEAVADSFSTDENSVLSVAAIGLLNGDTDVDLPNDTLSAVAATTTSSLGAVVVINTDGSFSYDPTSVLAIQQLTTGQSVLDTFTYTIQDAAGATSQPATVSVNVAGIDDAPVTADDQYSIGVGQSRLLDVLQNDSDIDSAIDPRTITITRLPIFGTATVNQTGVIDYEAGPGFRGIDTLGYTVRDVAGNVSNEATVTITVNNAPNAVDDSSFTFKNEPVEINVLDNDSDVDGQIDPNTLQVVVAPTTGTAELIGNGVIRFTPNTGFAGLAEFSYVVSDDLGTVSNVADVSVRVQNSRWQNPQGNLDVNADGFVSPIDPLIVINYINSGAETFLPNSGVTPAPWLDPTGDENVTPIDALVIINFLNNNSGGGGAEGEFGESQGFVMTVTPEQMIATVAPQIVQELQAAMDESLGSVLADDSDDSLDMATDSASSIYGPLPLDDEEEDLLDAISCSHDEVDGSQIEEAVDDFFSDMGPHPAE